MQDIDLKKNPPERRNVMSCATPELVSKILTAGLHLPT
jgi:hypothetical protein